jgi:50S ribosomal protein L16 3-hydroxylase
MSTAMPAAHRPDPLATTRRSPRGRRRLLPSLPPLESLWFQFVANQWGQTPGVLAGWPTQEVANATSIFRGVARASREQRLGHTNDGLRIYAGGHHVQRDLGSWLPPEGEPPAAYARRMRRRAPDGVMITVEDFQLHAPALWFATRRLFEGLFARVGLPRQRATLLGCFGDFLEVPYGVHPASAHNFLVVAAGSSAVRVWPAAAFAGAGEQWRHRTDYRQRSSQSILLEGTAGDILYWPAGWWHAWEGSARRDSAGINVLVFPEPQWDRGSLAPLAALLEQPLAAAARESSGLESIAPRLMAVARSQALRQVARIAALDHLTASGFAPVPDAARVPGLTAQQVVRGVEGACIVCRPWSRTAAHCSANGRSFLAPRHATVGMLFEWAGSRAPATVARVAARFSSRDGLSHAEVRAVLQKLYELRALAVARDGNAKHQ